MPRHTIGSAPFTVRLIDTDSPIDQELLTSALGHSAGVSLCIRSVEGHPDRGGYFFHVEQSEQEFIVRDFERHEVKSFDLATLVRFINHVSGREFDHDMFLLCQAEINFKEDQIDS